MLSVSAFVGASFGFSYGLYPAIKASGLDPALRFE
jgi:ABC-type antimicrobial peptide transport system permease subunit